jgi:N-methylhydantoinase B
MGSQHQGDVGIVMPLFHRGRHVGWAFSNLHVLDIGGMGVSGSAPAAVSVYDEALRFGAIRIIREGRVDEEWKRYLVQNVRTPGPVLNDIRSMIAANNIAEGKLQVVIDRFGLDRHRDYNEHNKRLTEQLLRRRIEAMPDGRYEAVEYIEFDAKGTDDLIEVRCTLEVSGSDLRFAFAGDPQVQANVNGTKGSVYGGVMTHVVTMLGYGDLPFNAGIWRPLSFDLGPAGTVVNAVAPAPVSMGHGETGFRCGKAARNVLNQAASLSEDAVLRSRVGGIASDAYAAACLFGHDQAGHPTVLIYMDTITGSGGGAQTVADGQDMYGSCTMAGGGLPDLEVHEATDPVLFLWRRIAQNSGGPGQRRGGQGLDQAYVLLGDSTFAGFTTVNCAQFPPPGCGGGGPPSSALQYPIRATGYNEWTPDAGAMPRAEESVGGRREMIGSKTGHFALVPGDVLRAIGGGGAGLGDPLLRDPEEVATDVRDRYITVEHAEAAYGVVLGADGKVDVDATDRRRGELRTARIGAPPERCAQAPDRAGVSVTVTDNGAERWWRCGYCEAHISPLGTDWREFVASHEVPIAERFEQLGMRVRARNCSPRIEVVEFDCPSCASCLAVDITTDRGRAGSPVLGSTHEHVLHTDR